jgi:hypothetical protein
LQIIRLFANNKVLVQFEGTPKALANFSPGLELATTLGSNHHHSFNPERVRFD